MPDSLPRRAVSWQAGLSRAVARFGDEGANVVVEFAFIAPLLIAIILASIEVSYVYFAKTELARIGQVAAMAVETEQAQVETYAQFKAQACGTIAVILQCAGLFISVTPQTGCGAVSTTLPNVAYGSGGVISTIPNYSPGNPGDIVVVQALYSLPVFGAQLFWGPSNPGRILIAATFVIANEP